MQKGKADFEDVGIMAGFKDLMNAPDEIEEEEDRDSYEEDNRDEMVADRRPDSPEILMNHLRGDMRSLDARRDELADMVGYQAAQETPDSVLAMLQPVLAQQQGLGTLPMAQGPQTPMPPPPPPGGIPPMGPQGGPPMGPPPGMPPGGLPPPPMPPGPGGPQPPMQMAHGGYVQHFQVGSGTAGVTPIENSAEDDEEEGAVAGGGSGADFGLGGFTKEDVATARAKVYNMLNQQPTPMPGLAKSAADRASVYKTLLGQDKGASEAQLLFSLGQRALQFAGNVDDQGRPLRGSFISRLAGATRTLPAEMSARMSEIEKTDRAIKLAAVQAAEKDIGDTRAYNQTLFSTQQKGWQAILRAEAAKEAKRIEAQGKVDAATAKAQAAKKPFGNSMEGLIMADFVDLAPKVADNTISDQELRQWVVGVKKYTDKRVERGFDEKGREVYTTITPELPEIAKTAMALNRNYQKRVAESVRNLKAGQTPAEAPASAPAPGMPAAAPSKGPTTGAVPSSTAGVAPRPTAQGPSNMERTEIAPGVTRDVVVDNATPQLPIKSTLKTIYELAPQVTGPNAKFTTAILAKIPFVGGKINPEIQTAVNYLNSTIESLYPLLDANPRYNSRFEREKIENAIDLRSQGFDSPEAFQNRAIGVDRFLSEELATERQIATDPATTPERKKQSLAFIGNVQAFRARLVPQNIIRGHDEKLFPQVNSIDQFNALPDGTTFWWNGEKLLTKNLPSTAPRSGAR